MVSWFYSLSLRSRFVFQIVSVTSQKINSLVFVLKFFYQSYFTIFLFYSTTLLSFCSSIAHGLPCYPSYQKVFYRHRDACFLYSWGIWSSRHLLLCPSGLPGASMYSYRSVVFEITVFFHTISFKKRLKYSLWLNYSLVRFPNSYDHRNESKEHFLCRSQVFCLA
jgi:hypothetical protein